MLHNNVFTYSKVSGFEKKESNHNRSVRYRFHSLNAAKSRLSPQMAELCKERIDDNPQPKCAKGLHKIMEEVVSCKQLLLRASPENS